MTHCQAMVGKAVHQWHPAFHPGTKKVAGGSYTGEVRLWNLDDGAELAKFVAAPGYTPPAAAAQK